MLIGILLFGMKHLHELLDIWSMIKVLVELLVISTLMDSLRSFEYYVHSVSDVNFIEVNFPVPKAYELYDDQLGERFLEYFLDQTCIDKEILYQNSQL